MAKLLFQGLNVAIFTVLSGYTAICIRDHGMDLLSIFFNDMTKYDWNGQFNLDFLFMLVFSATWTAWRNEFTPLALVLAVLAFFGGSLFLSVYLLVLSFTAESALEVVAGKRRAGAGAKIE
jgi:hypothetical protein